MGSLPPTLAAVSAKKPRCFEFAATRGRTTLEPGGGVGPVTFSVQLRNMKYPSYALMRSIKSTSEATSAIGRYLQIDGRIR